MMVHRHISAMNFVNASGGGSSTSVSDIPCLGESGQPAMSGTRSRAMGTSIMCAGSVRRSVLLVRNQSSPSTVISASSTPQSSSVLR